MENLESRYMRNVDPETTEIDTLSNWLENIYNEKVRFNRSAKEVDDIQDAVIAMVRQIIAEIGRIDDRFAHCTDTLVGSAGEGSKISEPDEFDFLIKISTLSLVPGVKIVRECSGRPGYAHVIIEGDTNNPMAMQWNNMITNGRLKSTDPATKTGLRDRYSYLLQEAIRRLQVKQMDVIEKYSGKLQLKFSVKTYGPSCVCLSRWIPASEFGGEAKSLDVDIDTVPAIHAKNWPRVVDFEEIRCKQARETMTEVERFMVIPCGRASCNDGLCFRLTFTNSEIILFNALSMHHRKCFKILKYLVKRIEPEKNEQSVLFSYSLKAFVFNHNSSCKYENDACLVKCIKSLLQDIKVCLSNKQSSSDDNSVRVFLSSICLSTYNIYDKDLEEFPLMKKEREIEKLIKRLDDIASESPA